ncbi:MAG: SMC-Scp complex subunit ScpB [Solirubrobacterales bacterium]
MSEEQLSTDRAAELARTIEALLFLSNHPVAEIELADACQVELEEIQAAVRILEADFERGHRGLVLRHVGEGLILATDPSAETAARRLLAAPRTPPLTQAQAETLSIVAYLQPVARPEIARIRGVSSESAVTSLSERGLIEESGRSRFGATIYRTSALFEKVFGLDGVDALPDPTKFDPTPEDEREIRERLLAAGEQRADQ